MQSPREEIPSLKEAVTAHRGSDLPILTNLRVVQEEQEIFRPYQDQEPAMASRHNLLWALQDRTPSFQKTLNGYVLLRRRSLLLTSHRPTPPKLSSTQLFGSGTQP